MDAAWFRRLIGRARKSRSKTERWNRDSLAPVLRVKRLEERRVLNADVAPVEQLVVDAGSAAGDGHADTYVVEQHDDHVRISVNGEEVRRTTLAEFDSISIHGSSDDDILIAEFKSGEPLAGLELLFDGGDGGFDTLTLVGDQSANEVVHTFGSADANKIAIDSPGAPTTIAYRGVEQVQDQLTAGNRVFKSDTGGQEVTVADFGYSDDGLSLLVAKDSTQQRELVIIFKAPTDALGIETSQSANESDSVELNGLDQKFDADLSIHGSLDDLLTVRGPTDLAGGNLSIVSGTIRIEDSLTTYGSDFSIRANSEIFISESGLIANDAGIISLEAPSIDHQGLIEAHGGQVHLDSGDQGTTIVYGVIDVSQSATGQGVGTVHILGWHVGLFDDAQINATAAFGAGTVLIGGDYQGKNSAIRNAAATYVGANVLIRADAGVAGDGGKVIVWADDTTRFYGTISALGGADGGDGGFAEVSGRGWLDYRGFSDLRAANGQSGTLLLDPVSITVSIAPDLNVTGTGSSGDPFRPLIIGPSNLDIDTLLAALASANVTVQTSGLGVGDGDLTVVDDIDYDLVGDKTLTLIAHNDIIINGSITDGDTSTADSLNLVLEADTDNNGTGDVTVSDTIETNGGDFDSEGIDFDNTGGTITTAGGDVTIVHTDDINISAAIDAGVGDVRLQAEGDITQAAAGTITADELGIRQQNAAAGNVTLTSENDVNELAVLNNGPAGTVTFRDLDDLTIDAVTAAGTFLATSGITTTNGDVLLNLGNTALNTGGPLTINQPIDAGTGDVRIVARGNVTQAAAGTITADELGIRQQNAAAGNVTLTSENDVNELAVLNNGPAGTVTFRDLDDLTIDAVTAAGTFLATSGITTTNGDVLLNLGNTALNTGGPLTINQPIDAGTGDVRIVARGNVTQAAAGTITADELGIRQQNAAAGNVTLTSENDVNELAVLNNGPAGTVTFRDLDDLTIDAVTAAGTFLATSGITTTNGDVLLNLGNTALNTGGPLTINQPIDAGTGDVRIVARGNVTQAAAGTITADELGIRQQNAAAGNVTLTSENDVNELAVLNNGPAGTVTFRDLDDLTIDAVTAAGTFLATSGITTTNGDVLLNLGNTALNTGGPLTINQPIDAGTGDVRIVARGNVTQAAAGTITADELGIRQQNAAAGNVTLTSENDVNELAVLNNGPAGTVTFRDLDDLTIDAVTAAGTFLATSGITTTNGDVLLNLGNTALNTGGPLTINQPIDAGTGDVRIVARGNVTQAAAGTITADELGIRQQNAAAGNVTLTSENDVNELAVLNNGPAGTVTFRDLDDLTIDAVTAAGTFLATSGITTTNGDVLLNLGNTALNTGGPLTINQPIDAGTGDVRIVARGNVTQAAAGTITADELGIRQQNAAAGNVTLTSENDVNELAVLNNGPAGTVTFRDLDDLTIDAVTAAGTFLATSGITTTNGDVLLNLGNTALNTGGPLTINQPIDAGTGDVRIVARGNVTQAAAGTITADELGIRQQNAAAGNVTLTSENDVNELAVLNNGPAGTVTFRDLDDLTIDAVTAAGTFLATSGITTTNGDVLLNLGNTALNTGGPLTINQPIDAGTGDVRIVARGNVTQAAAGTITADELGIRQQNAAAGNVTLTSENDVNELAVLNNGPAGTVTFRDLDDLTIDAVTAAGTFLATSGITTTNGDVLLNLGNTALNTGGPLTINQPIDAGTGDVRIVARGNVTQAAAGTITADELGIRQQNAAAGNVTLAADNDVNELAVNNQFATGTLAFTDIDDLKIENVTGSGTFAATTGVATVDGDVTLITKLGANHNLTLADETNAGNALVTMNAGDKILDSGAVGDNDIRAREVHLTAVNAIGTVSTFGNANVGSQPGPNPDSMGAGDAIEITVDSITAAKTTGAGSTIHLSQLGSLTLANLTLVANSIEAGGGKGQVIIQSTLDIDASAATAINLAGDDDLALLTPGTLTIPIAGFNTATTATPGDLRMVGGADVTAGGGTLFFKADDLFFDSGGQGGNANLDTNIVSLTTQLDANNLSVTESLNANNDIRLGSVTTTAGTVSVTTAAGGGGTIRVGLVDAANGAAAVTLNSDGAIDSLSDDNAPDVVGSVVTLIAANGGIGTTTILDVRALSAIDADTATGIDANILIDGIGNLPLGKVDAGTANVTLDATAAISDANANSVNIIGDDLLLSAATGIGFTGDLIDTNVAQFEGIGGTGGLFVTNLGALDVGQISGLFNGASATGDVRIETQAGNLQILEQVQSTSQSATVIAAANLAANSLVSAATTAALTAANGQISDGNAAATNVSATSVVATAVLGIEIDTTVLNMSAINSGVGNIVIRESNGANILNVAASSGGVDLSTAAGGFDVSTVSASALAKFVATGGAIADANVDSLNISAPNLHLEAGFGIGVALNAIETAVTNLEGSGGTGGVFVEDQDSLTIGGVSGLVGVLANGTVNISTSDGDLSILEVVQSTAQSVALLGADTLAIQADVTANAGNVDVMVGQENTAALTLSPSIILTGSGGQITGGQLTGGTINLGGVNFALLNNSIDLTAPPLTPSQNVARIRVIAADDGDLVVDPTTDATNFEITIDWKESNIISPQFDIYTIDGDILIINGESVNDFDHTYAKNPNSNPAAPIPVTVNITKLAGGSVQAFFGNQQLVGSLQSDGTYAAGVIGISVTILIPVLPFQVGLGTPPTPEPLPQPVQSPLIAEAAAEAIPVFETGATPFVAATASSTGKTEERYYELRVVYFKKNGQLDEMDAIRLDDEQLKAIFPFDPSKLPDLFGRLPADRYRLYLIEDGTERLVLDFIIQEGQPIELPEIEGGIESLTDPFQDEPEAPRGNENEPAAMWEGLQIPILAESASTGAQGIAQPPASFAERLGNASFVSHGGVVVGAAALAYMGSDRWEKSIDRLMERFDKRRQRHGGILRRSNKSRTADLASPDPMQLTR